MRKLIKAHQPIPDRSLQKTPPIQIEIASHQIKNGLVMTLQVYTINRVSYLEIKHLSNAGIELDSHHVIIEDVTGEDTVRGVGREEVSLKVYMDWKSSSNDTP